MLRLSARFGTIESGKLADLAVVDGNPMDNVWAMEKVVFVMKGRVRVR